jgi:N,N'-diacetyllegionaminate synthase
MSVLIIAEAGVNHDGNLEQAFALVDAAVDAGADIVKFQTFSANRLVTRGAIKAPYQKETTDPSETQYEMLRRLELSQGMHEALISKCLQKNIRFLSTGFDIESLNLLHTLGLDLCKIPSGEITNLPYLKHVGNLGKPVLLSTGMANLDEVEAAIQVIEASGTPRHLITILHCTTEYPTPMEDVNLRAMIAMKQTFGVEVGYSDHTPGIEVAIAAAAMGAAVIEKHFTLDKNLPGPDHKASLEPHELKAMVQAIRNIEFALGDGTKRPSPSELKNRPIARKSIVASRNIKAGELFSEDNLAAKRPGTGISPMRWDELMGLIATRDFAADELIEL